MNAGTEQTMVQPAVQIVHPLSLGGKARRWWVAARVAGIAMSIGWVSVVGWVIHAAPADVPMWMVALFAVLGCGAALGIQRLRFLAWAEIPGASRRFHSELEARRAFPRHPGDRALLAVEDLLVAAGAIVIVAITPTPIAHAVVGLFGGAFLAFFATLYLVSALERRFARRGDVVVALARLLVPLVWCVVGSVSWAAAALLAVGVPAMAFRLGALAVRRRSAQNDERAVVEGPLRFDSAPM